MTGERASEPGVWGGAPEGRREVKSPATRVGLVVAGVLQVAFAFLAFWDLAHREPDEVKGPKPAWIPVILVNWIGPAVYFLFGIRR